MIEGHSVFVVHRIVEIPSDECLRAPDRITWPTCRLKALLAEARANNLAILKIHRSEEHTSELQSLMRISYAVYCLQKTTNIRHAFTHTHDLTYNTLLILR